MPWRVAWGKDTLEGIAADGEGIAIMQRTGQEGFVGGKGNGRVGIVEGGNGLHGKAFFGKFMVQLVPRSALDGIDEIAVIHFAHQNFFGREGAGQTHMVAVEVGEKKGGVVPVQLQFFHAFHQCVITRLLVKAGIDD